MLGFFGAKALNKVDWLEVADLSEAMRPSRCVFDLQLRVSNHLSRSRRIERTVVPGLATCNCFATVYEW